MKSEKCIYFNYGIKEWGHNSSMANRTLFKENVSNIKLKYYKMC